MNDNNNRDQSEWELDGYDNQCDYSSDQLQSLQNIYFGHRNAFSHIQSSDNEGHDCGVNFQQKISSSQSNSWLENDSHSQFQLQQQRAKMIAEAKQQVVREIISENGSLQNLHGVVGRKLLLYRKRGMTQAEALNRVIQKLIHIKQIPSSNDSQLRCNSPIYEQQELIAKLRKSNGLTVEESQKTLQLKKEIDKLMHQTLNRENSNSSEDSSSNDQQQLQQHYQSSQYSESQSPVTKERLKIEKRYHKKMQRVMDTMIERVDHQSSSSGSCSSDERQKQSTGGSSTLNSKKRKYQEFIEGLKYNSLVQKSTESSSLETVKVQLYQSKRKHLNEQGPQQHPQNTKKRAIKDFQQRQYILPFELYQLYSDEAQFEDSIEAKQQSHYKQQRAKRLKNNE
ncbi:UNKNOWN [Stylonychia lemnae]|uniref:Uncharacterized protein n=1 Tax=Stylonychia lemnae TaxID=5949 RepID=A0A078AY97_STYLE|nr:UNKNOWN [Stylonychia lemnae]|eukprot:CDW87139.1 UNKNOWN [Stylonychia lemnae]